MNKVVEKNTKRTPIGVAGCGAMGLPMARNLLKAGFDVWGYDVRPLPEFGDFSIRMIEDPDEFSNRCSTIISVVRNWQQTKELCFGEQGLFNGPSTPDCLIISSTLSPRMITQLQQLLPSNVDLMDAPMSGAPFRAEDGSLTFMLGGDDELAEQARPLFEAMGNKIHHLGGLTTGMTCKVLNNLLAATSVVTVRRVMRDAEKLGLDPKKLLEVSSQSSGASWFGDHFDQISWALEGYSADNTIGILEKDVLSMLDAVSDHPELTEDGFEQAVLVALKNLKSAL